MNSKWRSNAMCLLRGTVRRDNKQRQSIVHFS